MLKKCSSCKCNPNKYWNLGIGPIKNDYKLSNFCQHSIPLLDNNNLCIKCSINNIRYRHKLKNIDNKDLTSMTCIRWKTGESSELYCWKNKIPMCDVLNCNYPVMKKYVQLENFINNVKNIFYLTIYLPIEIFNIIVEYTYKIEFAKKGLCIDHSKNKYVLSEIIFNSIPKCNVCIDGMSHYNQIMIIKELEDHNNYFNYDVTLYHTSSKPCQSIFSVDNKVYLFGGCISLCKQLNTWCNICKMCIGHTNDVNKIYTHNIVKYPHCEICGGNKHSEYPHCKICEIHSEYEHCQICNNHLKYEHCQICNIHSEYEHCQICNNHLKYEHCQICNIHSEYEHCEICNIHSEYEHCKICNNHLKYEHCEICDEHIQYEHCENCWNFGYENNVHHIVDGICKNTNPFDYKN
jgi:hypothetical protein